jgi:hypothetical protein
LKLHLFCHKILGTMSQSRRSRTASQAEANNDVPVVGTGTGPNEDAALTSLATAEDVEESFFDANEDDDDESSFDELVGALRAIQRNGVNNNDEEIQINEDYSVNGTSDIDNNINNYNGNDEEDSVIVDEPNDGRNNQINIRSIRRNIVSDNTNKSYSGDINHLLNWVLREQRSWLTDHGITVLQPIYEQRNGESDAEFKKRKLEAITDLIEHSFTNPILNLSAITPSRYMHYMIHVVVNTRARHSTIFIDFTIEGVFRQYSRQSWAI